MAKRTENALADDNRFLLVRNRFGVVAHHVVETRDVPVTSRYFPVDCSVDVVKKIQRFAEQFESFLQETWNDGV